MSKTPFFTSLPFSVLAVSGNKALEFLQGQLTCDMQTLSFQNPILGGYCNVKGRLHGLFYVVLQNDQIYLAFPYDPAVASHCQKILSQYAPFSRVTVTPNTDLKIWGIFEPSPEILESVRSKASVFTLPGSPQTAHLVFSTETPHFQMQEGSVTDWQMLEFEHLVPHITEKTVETFLPHDIHVVDLGGISFTKGCYMGQEIVARMHYKATLKKHLKLFQGREVLPETSEVVNRLDTPEGLWQLGVVTL